MASPIRAVYNHFPPPLQRACSFAYRHGLLLASAYLTRLDDKPPLDAAFSSGIRPLQVREEIESLAQFVSTLKPKTVVEIGTCSGGTLYLWCRLAAPEATIISVDLPGGLFGGGYPAHRVPLYRKFRQAKQTLHLIRADSHLEVTFERVKSLLPNRTVDFLFIDGDHSYEGVRRDFEMYTPLAKAIALHDVCEHPKEAGCNVHQFWMELKRAGYRTEEIIHDSRQGWAGIGVVYPAHVVEEV